MRFAILTILLMLLPVGCSNTSQDEVAPEPAAETIPPAEVSLEDIDLEIIDEAGLADVLKRHRGKVVLIDYWATWCGPCRKLFPHTVELHRKLAAKGLVVISLSLDEPENEPIVREFLAEQGAAFENYISRYGTGSKSFEVFDIPDGALPYLRLLNRDGTLSKAFADPIVPDHVDKAIEELLAVP